MCISTNIRLNFKCGIPPFLLLVQFAVAYFLSDDTLTVGYVNPARYGFPWRVPSHLGVTYSLYTQTSLYCRPNAKSSWTSPFHWEGVLILLICHPNVSYPLLGAKGLHNLQEKSFWILLWSMCYFFSPIERSWAYLRDFAATGHLNYSAPTPQSWLPKMGNQDKSM